jgi:hypothetical protein
MSLEVFARQSLAQFAIIYGEIFKLNEGKAINPSEIETLMWGRMCAKEAGIVKTGFKIPYDNIKRAKVTLPYMPDDINYTGCCAIKKNGGLYTPCCGKVAEDTYCKSCSVDKEGESKEIEFGAMDDRDQNVEDGRFAPITFAEWMKGHKTTLPEVYAKLRDAGIALEIPANELTCRELPKRRKGRPAKSDDSVVDEDSVPKKSKKAKSPAASDDEAPKPKAKAKVVKADSDNESESEVEAPKPKAKKASPAASEDEAPKAKAKKAEASEDEKPKKAPKAKKAEVIEDEAPKPKAKKASPAASDEAPKAKAKAKKAEVSEDEAPKPKAKKASPAASEDEAPKAKAPKAKKSPAASEDEKPKKASKPKAEEPKKKASSGSESDTPKKAKKAKVPEPVPEPEPEAEAEEAEEEEMEEQEIEIMGEDGEMHDYMLRNGKFICSMEDGTILGTVNDEGEPEWSEAA